MASRLSHARPDGTDGSDFMYRATVENVYEVRAQLLKRLGVLGRASWIFLTLVVAFQLLVLVSGKDDTGALEPVVDLVLLAGLTLGRLPLANYFVRAILSCALAATYLVSMAGLPLVMEKPAAAQLDSSMGVWASLALGLVGAGIALADAMAARRYSVLSQPHTIKKRS